jgi:steroid delta-isomerase-like uncharacterized protein
MKIYLLVIPAILTLFSCNQPKENSGENEKLVKQYFEYFNKHDWHKMAAMYSDTAAFKDPSLGQGVEKQTKAQIIKKYGELSQIFPDVKDEIISVYPSGDKHIIVEFVSTGTAPDSSKFELPICTIFKIENGLITQDFTYFDNFEQ